MPATPACNMVEVQQLEGATKYAMQYMIHEQLPVAAIVQQFEDHDDVVMVDVLYQYLCFVRK